MKTVKKNAWWISSGVSH